MVLNLRNGLASRANAARWRIADEPGIALRVTILTIQNSNRMRELLTNQNAEILDFNAEILEGPGFVSILS